MKQEHDKSKKVINNMSKIENKREKPRTKGEPKKHWLCYLIGHDKGLHGKDGLNWCKRCVWYIY